MFPATLSSEQLKSLSQLLEVGHRLEKLWAQQSSSIAERQVALEQLSKMIAALSDSPVDALKRLSQHVQHLSLDMTAKHLAGILVPFERLRGRALRDDEFLVDEGDKLSPHASIGPLKIFAENIRSAFNVGALLRTAECYGVEEVVLAGYTPTPENEKTAKTSLGAQESVAWSSEPSVQSALTKLKADGFEIVALETVESATSLEDFKWPEKSVLVVGNERFGVDDETLRQADHFVRLPLFGKKNSLNVGIACGIALADWRTKYESRQQDSAVHYQPIGTFRSDSVHRYEAPRQGVVNASGQVGVIHVKPQFAQALQDLDGFERIWIVYDFHHNKNWKPLIRPPRGPLQKRGVFATRAPYRPNPVGLSCVELVRVDGHDVIVKGFDLLDGTPVLDLKPYLPYADSFPGSKIGWLEGIDEIKHSVTFSDRALEQIEWLEALGVNQLRGFLQSQLEFDPIDSERKRIELKDRGLNRYAIAYRTWRAVFSLKDSVVLVETISSGYSRAELDDRDDDKYGDKELHRKFEMNF